MQTKARDTLIKTRADAISEVAYLRRYRLSPEEKYVIDLLITGIENKQDQEVLNAVDMALYWKVFDAIECRLPR